MLLRSGKTEEMKFRIPSKMNPNPSSMFISSSPLSLFLLAAAVMVAENSDCDVQVSDTGLQNSDDMVPVAKFILSQKHSEREGDYRDCRVCTQEV